MRRPIRSGEDWYLEAVRYDGCALCVVRWSGGAICVLLMEESRRCFFFFGFEKAICPFRAGFSLSLSLSLCGIQYMLRGAHVRRRERKKEKGKSKKVDDEKYEI